MLAALPILTLGLCVLGIGLRLKCWRSGLLAGATLFGIVLVAATELLSAAHLLTVPAMAVVWCVTCAACAVYLRGARGLLQSSRAPRSSVVMLASLGGMVLVLGAIAWEAPPNSLDSLTYHMPRVVHWIQNASVAHYPTYELRQLYLQPGAEYAILHLQLLSGGDHLAGLVQWASMLGTLAGISLVAGELGADRCGQVLATIFAASLPIGILESTSTQNDYVDTFWLVCCVAFAVRLVRSPSWLGVVALGASTGLALLAKATAYVFVLPFLVWVCVCVLRGVGRAAVPRIVLVAALALAVNSGFYVRNAVAFGSPFGAFDEGTPTTHYLNDRLTPTLLVSNVVRDLGLNFVATPLAFVNQATERLVTDLHALIGVDPADPSTTWGSETFSARAPGLAFDENFASNPLHVLLLVAAVAVIAAGWRHWPGPVVAYAIALGAGFLLFSAVLRWQPWHTRLELPLLVLGAPLVALAVPRVMPRATAPLSLVLLLSMLPWVVYNQARPLVGPRSILTQPRLAEYFINLPNLRASYTDAAQVVAQQQCGRVGLLPNGYEYLVWAALQDSAPRAVRIESAIPGQERFEPCALLGFDGPSRTGPVQLQGRTYQPRWSEDQVSILT